MPRYERPETGACDAMASNYGHPAPCTRKAVFVICGHSLCERHAQIAALALCEQNSTAQRIPGTRKTGLTFVPNAPRQPEPASGDRLHADVGDQEVSR